MAWAIKKSVSSSSGLSGELAESSDSDNGRLGTRGGARGRSVVGLVWRLLLLSTASSGLAYDRAIFNLKYLCSGYWSFFPGFLVVASQWKVVSLPASTSSRPPALLSVQTWVKTNLKESEKYGISFIHGDHDATQGEPDERI